VDWQWRQGISNPRLGKAGAAPRVSEDQFRRQLEHSLLTLPDASPRMGSTQPVACSPTIRMRLAPRTAGVTPTAGLQLRRPHALTSGRFRPLRRASVAALRHAPRCEVPPNFAVQLTPLRGPNLGVSLPSKLLRPCVRASVLARPETFPAASGLFGASLGRPMQFAW
jgi:hypothetical protein